VNYMAAHNNSLVSSPAADFLAIPGKGITLLSPAAEETKLEHQDLRQLRRAIHRNRVSFPSQVPTFGKHDRPDLQRKLVQLFFVCGWSCNRIAQRYDLIPKRVQQILNTWRIRAVQTGYIQAIPPLDKSRMVAGVSPIHVTLFAHPEVSGPVQTVPRDDPAETPGRSEKLRPLPAGTENNPTSTDAVSGNTFAAEAIQEAVIRHCSASNSQAILLLVSDDMDPTQLLEAAVNTGARIYTIAIDGSLQSLNVPD
jgi:hypothetical protein